MGNSQTADGRGDYLKSILTLAGGQELSGQPLTTSGEGKNLQLTQSHRPPISIAIGSPVYGGGQAAVARSTVAATGEVVALRVERHPQTPGEHLRAAAMVKAGELSLTQPSQYPALLRVLQSFAAGLVVYELRGRAEVGVICSVQEWCSPLRTYLENHPNGMPYQHAVGLLLPVIQTMGRLHQVHNWVHRDIDETNILVASNHTLRIADLGIVSIITQGRDYSYTKLWGKKGFMPPEVAEFQRNGGDGMQFRIEPSYDVWQLGRVLYMMLTGDLVKASAPDAAADPLQQWVRRDDITDPVLRQILARMADRVPKARPTMDEAFIELSRWLDNIKPPAPRPHTRTTHILKVGSNPDNDVVLAELDPYHLEAERFSDGAWVVRDVSKARRGFLLNGQPKMWAQLQEGDEANLGSFSLKLRSDNELETLCLS